MPNDIPGITLSPIQMSDVSEFRSVLDAVARERRSLPRFSAPPLPQVEDFVRQNIALSRPQFVARDYNILVGWCDIIAKPEDARQHCGVLGIGLLPAYRGKGIGTSLMNNTLKEAQQQGLTRVELKVRSSNVAAIALYKKFGFVIEGTLRNDILDQGKYADTEIMGLLLS